MFFHPTRKNVPWEVINYRVVEPVSVCEEDEEDLDISRVAEEDMSRTFVFDITEKGHFRNAIVFARQLLIQDMIRANYNMLLTEGWESTLLRRGKQYRMEVRYSGRPAHVVNKACLLRKKQHSSPPFIMMLDTVPCS